LDLICLGLKQLISLLLTFVHYFVLISTPKVQLCYCMSSMLWLCLDSGQKCCIFNGCRWLHKTSKGKWA